MIVRVLTASVPTRQAGQFNELLRKQLPILHAQEGLVYVKLARRIEGPIEEVLLFEEWRDIRSLYAWAGRDLTKPRLLPGTVDLVEHLSITHYEALDLDPTFEQPVD